MKTGAVKVYPTDFLSLLCSQIHGVKGTQPPGIALLMGSCDEEGKTVREKRGKTTAETWDNTGALSNPI